MISVPVSGALRTQAFECFLAHFLEQHQNAGGQSTTVELDLAGCTFIEAPAAAMLCMLAYHLTVGDRTLHIVPPSDLRVRAYYEGCGLAGALSNGGVGPRAGDMPAAGDFVLPVCRVQNGRDVSAISGFIYESVEKRLRSTGNFASRSRSVIDALCENIVTHAEAGLGGWAAAQVHRTREGEPFLRIGVVDTGVGIPVTMARRHDRFASGSPTVHCEAILAATQPGVTGSQTGGGIGLTQVRKLVRDCRGTLHIRSLTGSITTGIYGTNRAPVTLFPGTQLHVLLK